jgi:hypothetical protein
MGERDIPATLGEAQRGFIPSRSNRTPSATVRIDALISYLWKTSNNGQDISDLKKHFDRLQFRALTRECRVNMKQDGIRCSFWGDLSDQQKLYYCLKLEKAIATFGYPIFRCRRQWAAGLLLQEAMKSERQTAHRRQIVSFFSS